MHDFHFLRPGWFWTLLPLALLLAWFAIGKIRNGQWAKVVDPQLLEHVLTGEQHRGRLRPLALLGLAGMLAITALAGPAWKKLPLPVFKDQSALMILLDLSRSMDSQDLKPSRLERARHKLTDILRQRRTGQTGLIVYAAQPYTVTPLTDDTETINAHVSSLSTDLMPAQGSRPDLAIRKAMELFDQAGVRHGKVLFITDGLDSGQVGKAVDDLTAAGHELRVLGVGSAGGAPVPVPGSGFLKDASGAIVIPKLDEAALRQVVAGRGMYHGLTIDDSDINYLLAETPAAGLNLQTKETDLKTDTWRDEGPWLLLPVLLLAALAFRRGLLVAGIFLLLPLSKPADAFEWNSLWLNRDQRGAQKLDEGDAEQAAGLFGDPEWRGVAQYRAGNYEAAVDSLNGIETADALYNKGNALAQLGRTDEAISAYEQALKLNPQHEDARYNRDQLLKQQQNAQQQSDSQQNKDNRNNQDQQSDSQQNKDGRNNQDQQNAGQQQGGNGGEQPQESSGQQQSAQQQQNQAGQQANNASTENQPGGQQEQNAGQEHPKDEAFENAGQPESDRKDESTPGQSQGFAESDEEPDPKQQATEQWLRRIPDDPSGLLRRKFLYQYRRQQQSQPGETKPW